MFSTQKYNNKLNIKNIFRKYVTWIIIIGLVYLELIN